MTIRDFEKNYRNYVPSLMGARGRYAVLVPLVERPEGLSLLFEVRASTLARQPGEVCYPGGRMEPNETAEQCALRETKEELGIPPQAVRVIGHLDFLQHRSGFLLFPVLGVVAPQAIGQMELNPEEVGDVFFVPVSFFEQNRPVSYQHKLHHEVSSGFPYARIGFPDGYQWQPRTERVLIYENEGPPIWGLTALITEALMNGITSHFPE